MALSLIFSGALVFVLLIGVVITVLKLRKTGFKRISPIGALVIVVSVLGLALIPNSFHTVEAGEIAVVKHLGEAKKVRTAGTYFDFWITDTYEYYDAKVQNMSIVTQAYSKDAQTMSIAMSVQYKIDESKVIDIANQYGTISMLANRIESIATDKTKATLSS